MDSKANKNLDMVIYILLTLLMMAGWKAATSLPFNTGEADFPVNYNFFVYMAAILGVLLGALLLFFLTTRLREAFDGEGTAGRVVNALLLPGFLACAAALLLMVYRVYRNENTLYPGNMGAFALRQQLPPLLYFSAIALPAFLIFLLSKGAARQNRALRWVVGVFISFLCALYQWCPNPFMDSGAGILHIDAYTTTIINTAELVPFDYHHINIYGHHGILYLPLVRLFGNDFRAVTLAIALFTFLTFLAVVYVADVLLKRDLVFYLTLLACLATCTLLTRSGVYYQIVPHRLLFPMLSLACLAWEAAHPRAGIRIGRLLMKLLIATLAFVWNFETGLFTAAVFACCGFLMRHYDEDWLSLKAVRGLAGEGMAVVLSFAGAYGLVLAYNRAVGGGMISVRAFIYPLLSGTYHVDHLRIPLPSVGHFFFLEILMFGFSLLPILRGRRETAEAARPLSTLTAGIALSGFGCLTYFINRTAYGNLSITTLQMFLLMGRAADLALGMDRAILTRDGVKANRFLSSKEGDGRDRGELAKDGVKADRFLSSKEGDGRDRGELPKGGVKAYRLFQYALGAIVFFVLLWIAIESVLYIHTGVEKRMEGGWNTQASAEFLEEVTRVVPKDTLAYGMGLPQIYYCLGWDPQIRPTDFPDMNDENRAYIDQEREKVSTVFISRRKDEPALCNVPEDYAIVWEKPFGPMVYMYCEKTAGGGTVQIAEENENREPALGDLS